MNDMDRMHYKINSNVKDLFEEDKSAFIPLPAEEFDCCKYVWAKTNIQGKASFETNKYSTAGNLPNRRLMLKIKAHNVTVYDQNHKEVVRHERLYGKDKESMIWMPYLNVLAKRPNALKYTGFFESLDKDTREFLNAQDLPGKKIILTELAKACEVWGIHKSLTGIDKAIKIGAKDADTLVSAFHFAMNIPGKIPKNQVPDNLPKTKDYVVSLSEYSKFMEVANRVQG
jgi:hypothetical protein